MMVSALRLRTILALLVLAITLPLGGFSAWLLWRSWEGERAHVAEQNIEQARAIMVAVDQQIDRTIAALHVLAELNPIDYEDRSHFMEIASRIMPMNRDWLAVRLIDTSLNVVGDSSVRAGDPLKINNPDWVHTVLRTRKPAVSTLRKDPVSGAWTVMVAVPVERGGKLKYVLAVRLAATAFADILARQKAPPGGVVALLDPTPVIIARTRNAETYVGQPPTDDFLAHSRAAPEGHWETRLLEGTRAYSAWSRSPLTGWTVGIGVAAEAVDGPIRRSFIALATVGFAILAAGILLALLLSRGVVRAQRRAVTAARALARGEPVPTFPSRIAEAQALSAGLHEAGAILQRRMAERDAAQSEADTHRAALLEREQSARRAAEALSRSQEEFVATVSHELRTPLNAILGWVAMLKTGSLDPARQAHALDVIERNSRAQVQLVEDLLDMSRAIRGTVRLDMQPIDLTAVLQTTVDSLKPTAHARRIALALHHADGRAVVSADHSRLQQVLYNLLANALKFTPSGGRVDARLSIEQQEAVVRIIDTGEGIAPEFLPHVFDRFRQETGDVTRVHSGLGIGLSLVRHMTELHGGSVTADSDGKGRGATFTVRLPVLSEAPSQHAVI